MNQMQDDERRPMRPARIGEPMLMGLSALIFGYFGFGTGLTANNTSGQFVLMFAMYLWTLRVCAVLFALSVVVSLAHGRAGDILYCGSSLLSAVMFGVILVMDLMDPVNQTPWIMLAIFMAWNGYGALTELTALFSSPRR